MSTPDEPWWTHIHSGGTPEMVIIWYIICFNLMLQWYPNSSKKNADLSLRIRKKIVPHHGITGILGFDKLLWGSRPSVCRCPRGSTCRADAVSPSVEHKTWRFRGDPVVKMEALYWEKNQICGNFQQTHVGSPEGLLCNHCKNCINLSGSQSVSFYWQLL